MLTSDFEGEWKSLMITELGDVGVPIDSELDIEEIAIAYQNVMFQRVSITPRIIEKSDVFSCPPNLQMGLELFENKVSKGEDLNWHRSRKTGKQENDDDLLSDWGVFHFHLGITQEADGFVERTGPVLFAVPAEKHFYMIQIYDHGAWAQKDVLETIHRNWPHILAQKKLSNFFDIALEYDSPDVALARKNHYNSYLKMSDGTIYSPPGGGLATSGRSISAVMRAMKSIKEVRRWDKHLRSQPENLIRALMDLGYDGNADVTFALRMDSTGVYAYSDMFNARFKLKDSASQS